jgi:hypothetical protein
MQPYRICLTVALLGALAASCTSVEQERRYRTFFNETAQALVPDFRLPDESQYGPAWAVVEGQGWRTLDGTGETKAEFWTSGEFNGDGTIDYVYILVEKATDTRTLFAFVSVGQGYEARQLDAGFEWGIWLRTLPPGRYAIAGAEAEARAANGDSPPAALEFEARNQVIEFFQFEGAASSFAWNATAQSFDRFRTRD